MILASTDPIWVASQQQLRSCCEILSQARAIAVDTEFMRSNTFFPKAALFQLYAGEHCYLVDPLAIDDFSPLVTLLVDPNIVKVFHACSEDLEVFSSFLNCVPRPLVDTQIAAAMLHHGTSTSYAAMVEAVLGVSLEKGETRSDWLQRPLEARQLHYAVQDVIYLLPLYHKLMHELAQAGRLDWLRQDCELLVAAAQSPADLDGFYLRVKSAWKLRPQELMVLRHLSRWREDQARQRDMPRNHVVHERVLWNLAKQQPRSMDELKAVEGMEHRKLKQIGRELLKLIAEARSLGPEHHPEALPAPLPLSQRDLVKALKACVAEKAEALQVFPEILAKKSDVDYIVRSGLEQGEYRLPERLMGWRRQVIGEPLLQAARQVAATGHGE